MRLCRQVRTASPANNSRQPICPTVLAQRTAKSNAKRSGPCFRATISGESHPFRPKNGPDPDLQFSSVLPQSSNRFSSKATPAEKNPTIPMPAKYENGRQRKENLEK